MTLQTGVVFHDGIRLWTDTAWRDCNDLRLIAHGPKAFYATTQLLPFAGVVANSGANPLAISEHINRAFPANLHDLLKASTDALRDYARDGSFADLLLAAWDNGPKLYFMTTREVPGILAAFTPIERTTWFSPEPDGPAYREGMAEGFTPELADAAVREQIGTAYDNGVNATVGKWIAGNIIELTVTAEGTAQRIIETVPDAIAA